MQNYNEAESKRQKTFSIKKICISKTHTVPNSKTAILAILWHLPLHIISLMRVWIHTIPQKLFSKNTGKSKACNGVASKLLRGEIANMIAFWNIISSTQGWIEGYISAFASLFVVVLWTFIYMKGKTITASNHDLCLSKRVMRSILKTYHEDNFPFTNPHKTKGKRETLKIDAFLK